MTRRELPVEEWHRLAQTDLATIWPALKPDFAKVLAVEDQGQLVGCWGLIQAVHAEGIWVHPDYREKVGVGRHLVVGMRHLAQESGVKAVFTAAIDPAVAGMILSCGGTKLPGEHFILPMEPLCHPL